MKKIIVLLLTVSMLMLMLAACSDSEPTQKATTKPTNAADNEETEDSEKTADNEEAADTSAEEVTEIEIMLYDLRGVSAKAQSVIDEINKLTEKEIGVTAKVTWIGSADYTTQLSLAISGNEGYDLASIIPRDGANFSTLSANGQLMDITDLLNEYGPETKALVADYFGAYTIDGRIYGVPTYRNYSSSVYLTMRKDILEQVGMLEKAQNLTSWSQAEEIFAAVADQTDLAPIAGTKNVSYQPGMIFGTDEFAGTTIFDNLSDILNVIYVDENGKVKFLAEEPAFKHQMEMVKRWYDNGWVYEDSLITEEHADTLIKANVVFSAIQTSEIGVETSKREATGYEVVCAKIATNMVASNFVNKFGTCVPVTADDPEAAIKWLNELYTNPAMINLLDWGIEGTDYVVENGEANYPAGIDATSVNYHTADFVYGNYFNALPWKGNGADFRSVAMEALKSAPISKYLGFSANQAELTNVIAALTSAYDQYRAAIFCGAWSEKDYQTYIDALKTAGADGYIASYQEQLDKFMANK